MHRVENPTIPCSCGLPHIDMGEDFAAWLRRDPARSRLDGVGEPDARYLPADASPYGFVGWLGRVQQLVTAEPF